MEPQNPLEDNQIESKSMHQISDKNPAPNNNINSQEQIQLNSESNKGIENNENQNINDNNSDYINNNNYNEEEALPEEEENNQNIDQNNYNRLIQINNNNMNNGGFEIEGEMDYNNDNEQNIYNNQNHNNINANIENNNENNENENMQQPQLIINAENIDEPLQNYLYELQNKLNLVMNENDKLRMINQKIVIGLNESKKRNMALNQKIKILNLQNQKMNQELIKLKQVKNNDTETKNLKNQIQNYEKMFFKLNNDKKILESKIINMQMQIQSPNQIKNLNLLNYKNSHLIRSPKAKFAFTQSNTMTNENNQVYKNQIIILEKNNKKLSQSNNELENQNKYLQRENQRMFVDLKKKDNYILSLKDKITAFNKEYNKQINNFSTDNDQKQSCLDQLFFERDQLIKENQELRDRLNQVNYKLNEFSVMNKMYKTEYHNDKVKQMYEDKLEEYKRKIIILKQRVNELLGIETHGNNVLSRGNSARFGHQNLDQNGLKKNRSFKYNKNLNILTDFNLYNERNRTMKDYRKIYSNFNFGTK